MDLKKLLAEREAVLKEKEIEQLIEVKIEGYSENFKLHSATIKTKRNNRQSFC